MISLVFFFFSFFHTVFSSNNLKTDILVHDGLFWCLCMMGYLSVSITHQTLTLKITPTCVCDLYACIYARETWVYSLIRKTFVESAHNFTPQKYQSGRKAYDVTVNHPSGDQAGSCWCCFRSSALALCHRASCC